jgi:MoaA/NifB/PqqE/SkfB family radical SAM enzyme
MRVRKRPFVLSHGINARCNLSCRFCEYWRNPGREMSTLQVMKMLDEAADFGIGVYNAWTVEPLLRKDLPDILQHAKSLGVITSLITNGLLLKKRSRELDDLDLLSVSVDGIKSYRELRGVDLQEIIDGIRAAQQAGHEILMNCVISGRNAGELEDLVHLAESLGCWISFEPMQQSQGIDESIWRSLDIRNVAAFKAEMERLMELKQGGSPIINSLSYLQMVKNSKDSKGSDGSENSTGLKGGKMGFRCHAADIILHVAPDGTICTCRVNQEALGNVSDGLAGYGRKRKSSAMRS